MQNGTPATIVRRNKRFGFLGVIGAHVEPEEAWSREQVRSQRDVGDALYDELGT